MSPELKAKWLADLRSGKYPKTTQFLKRAGGYCCLGVLLESAGVGFTNRYDLGPVHPVPHGLPDGETAHDGSELSEGARDLFGITRAQHDRLIDINDNTDTFDKVIDYIEDTL